MYEYLQWLHVLVFAPLVLVREFRLSAVLLCLSAIVYIAMEPTFDHWNSYSNVNPYHFRATLDVIVAQIIFYYGGRFGKKQAIILCLLCITNVYSMLEFYTERDVMYNHYVIITQSLNVAQLLVATDGIVSLFKLIRDAMDRGFSRNIASRGDARDGGARLDQENTNCSH